MAASLEQLEALTDDEVKALVRGPTYATAAVALGKRIVAELEQAARYGMPTRASAQRQVAVQRYVATGRLMIRDLPFAENIQKGWSYPFYLSILLFRTHTDATALTPLIANLEGEELAMYIAIRA